MQNRGIRTWPWGRGLMVLALAAVAGGLWVAYHDGLDGPDADDAQERPIVAPSRVARDGDRVFVVLNRDDQEKAGVVTVMADATRQGRQINSFGTVIEPGEIIDAIASVRSAKAQLASVEAKTAASTAAWMRAKALYADGKSLSTAQMQLAEEAYRGDEAAKAESLAKVSAIEESLRQNWGDALTKDIVGGLPAAMALQNGKQLLVRVPLPMAPPPDHVEIDWDTGASAQARLVTQLPKVDPRFQQRLSLYGVAAVSGPPPGITVGVKVAAGVAAQGIKVPASAVVWWDGAAWIYAQTDEDRFTRVKVADPTVLGDGAVFVADGPENQPVVSQGAQLLLSEESRDRIQVGEEGRSK